MNVESVFSGATKKGMHDDLVRKWTVLGWPTGNEHLDMNNSVDVFF